MSHRTPARLLSTLLGILLVGGAPPGIGSMSCRAGGMEMPGGRDTGAHGMSMPGMPMPGHHQASTCCLGLCCTTTALSHPPALPMAVVSPTRVSDAGSPAAIVAPPARVAFLLPFATAPPNRS